VTSQSHAIFCVYNFSYTAYNLQVSRDAQIQRPILCTCMCVCVCARVRAHVRIYTYHK